MKSPDVKWDHFRTISLEDWAGFRKRVPTRIPPQGCAWLLSPLAAPVEVRDADKPNWQVCCLTGEYPPRPGVVEKAHAGLQAEHYARRCEWASFTEILESSPAAVGHILQLQSCAPSLTTEVDLAKDYARIVAAVREALDIQKEIDAESPQDSPQ